MNSRIENLATGLLVVCAVIVTGLAVKRSLRADETPSMPTPRRLAQDVPGLREGELRSGSGSLTAKVVVVEFSDFQCPFCAQGAKRLDELEAAWPNDLTVVHRHFPLSSIHAHARAAAIAAECAHHQGRFGEFRKVVFARREEIGVRDWPSFATLAGVRDAEGFRHCMDDPQVAERVERDVQIGTTIGVLATPTYVVQDRMFAGGQGLDVVESMLRK